MSFTTHSGLLEKALNATELEVRQLIDAMPHMAWMATAELGVDFMNRRWEEYTRLPVAALLGYGWVMQVHPDDREAALSEWQKAIKNGAEFQVDCRVLRHDGAYRWFDTRVVALRDAQGRIVKWFGTNTDVHETYEALRVSAESEERLRYVALATHDSIYDWDMRTGITYRNDTFQTIFGAPPITQKADDWWRSQIHADDRKRIVDSASASFRAREPKWNGEYRMLRADGSYATVNDRAYLLYDAKKKPLRMIGAIADITTNRQVEQSLRDAQARLLSAMEVGGLATWIWDIPTDSLWWDDAAFRMWGMSRDEIGELTLTRTLDFIHPEDKQGIEAAVVEFYRTGIDMGVEFRTLRADRALQWLQIRQRMERDANGQPIRMAGVYIDITQRKRAEEAQLRTQKMEALGTLAGGIAHDFNNILLAISGNAKLAMTDLQLALPAEHSVQRNLREIEKASARAADLVRRILTFSRQQDAQREVVQLRPLIEDALRLLRPTLPASIKIRTAYADDVGLVATEAMQVQQVVMNLVTNAMHAIGAQHGIIDINLTARYVSRAEIDDLPIGRYACLAIRDTGSGIDKSIVDRIFDPFFTTKQVGQGTGLGLAVVHGIVEAHGGAITVDSELNKGTVFHVYFPEINAPVATVEQPVAALLRGTGEHVLYVDDEEALVFLVSRVLERMGYRVTGCVDPVQAITEFRAHPNTFHAVVTDLSMRGMNGFELTRAIHAVRADIPVILTSGYLRTEDRETAQQCGIRELILKPNTVEELGQSLDRVLSELRAANLKLL